MDEAAIGQDAHLWDVQRGNTKAADCRSLGRCLRDQGMRSNNVAKHSFVVQQQRHKVS